MECVEVNFGTEAGENSKAPRRHRCKRRYVSGGAVKVGNNHREQNFFTYGQ
jgi:hypothetical protein